jgi:hypothetical protein
MSESSPELQPPRRELEVSISRWSNQQDAETTIIGDLVRRIRLLENLKRHEKATRAAQQALHEGADEIRIFKEGTIWQRRRDEWFRTEDWREGPSIVWGPTPANPQ